MEIISARSIEELNQNIKLFSNIKKIKIQTVKHEVLEHKQSNFETTQAYNWIEYIAILTFESNEAKN